MSLVARYEISGGPQHWTGTQRVTVVLALLALVLLGMRQEIQYTITSGYILAGMLLPVWWPSLKQFWGAHAFLLVGTIALVSGVWLAGLSSADHEIERSVFFGNGGLLIGLLLTMGVVMWARQVMPIGTVALAYGIGMLLGVSGDGRAAENPWKFAYSMPVIIIVLALIAYLPRWSDSLNRIGAVIALAILAGISGSNNARSLFAMLGLALVLVLWQAIPRGRSLSGAISRTAMAFGIIALVTYNVIVSMLLSGYLGEDAQQRSLAQIRLTGSLLLGGRPEMAGSVALFMAQPWGHGLGVVPNLNDILIAKSGMAAIHYRPNNGYVENYMFGHQFELHSVTADLWSFFGISGLILALLILTLLLRWVFISIALRQADAVVLFLAIYGLWNLFFSPLFTAVTAVGLGLGLAMVPKGTVLDRSVTPGDTTVQRGNNGLSVRGGVMPPGRFG